MMPFSKTKIQECLKNNNKDFVEELALKARKITNQYFGRAISLYAPLYLSNYCNSYCRYCGFNSRHQIKRYKLTEEEITKEMQTIAKKGIENILLLTGESYQATPLPYLEKAVTIGKDFFPSISLEVHPLEEEAYHRLFLAGVDGITIYQETYNPERYQELHLEGKKKDYHYRKNTPLRAAQAGIRNISLGILLGLFDPAEDLYSLYQHLKEMEKTFPGVEYSLSFPRLQPIQGQTFCPSCIEDITLLKIICLTRILFPRVGINLSTRESETFRNHAVQVGVTRISAESNTNVGGYSLDYLEKNNPQFDVKDTRTVEEIIDFLKKNDFDPVLTDWRRITNEPLN